jgi:hypothetical protein
MKTFEITILKDNETVERLLNELVGKQLIELEETTDVVTAPSDEQVQEIIEESELVPHYSKKEAKDILNL